MGSIRYGLWMREWVIHASVILQLYTENTVLFVGRHTNGCIWWPWFNSLIWHNFRGCRITNIHLQRGYVALRTAYCGSYRYVLKSLFPQMLQVALLKHDFFVCTPGCLSLFIFKIPPPHRPLHHWPGCIQSCFSYLFPFPLPEWWFCLLLNTFFWGATSMAERLSCALQWVHCLCLAWGNPWPLLTQNSHCLQSSHYQNFITYTKSNNLHIRKYLCICAALSFLSQNRFCYFTENSKHTS